jgi:hypothetical protein
VRAKLRGVRKETRKPSSATVRALPEAARRPPDVAARAPLPPAAPPAKLAPVSIVLGKRPAAEAWAQIAAPLAEHLGERVLFEGMTGSGKTTGIKDYLRFIEERKLADLIIIHDVKKSEKQYEGVIIGEAREIKPEELAAGIESAAPVVRILRRRNLDHMPSVEDAARVTLERGYEGIDSIFVIDEFQRALTDGGKFESPSVRRLFCEGLGLHASIIAGKQMPQFTPTEATGQSAKIRFRMMREATNYLVDDKKISKEIADVIVGLPTGSFLLFPEERDFDGYIYEVPPP